MQTTLNRLVIGLTLLLFFSCKANQKVSNLTPLSKDDGIIEFTFLQINDVYEIAPLEDGKVGGMARVATLYKQLKKENPNTLFVHAGDFLNPSLIGTMKHEGASIKGRQMVEVMNACGVDLVVFGNHEFDIKENELQARMNESTFDWLGTNVLHVTIDKNIPGDTLLIPFHKEQNGKKTFVSKTYNWAIKDADGTTLDIGVFGATIDKNLKPFVHYQDHTEEATTAYLGLKSESDLIVGLTHLEIGQDLQMAANFQDVPLLMGGHDHHHMEHEVGNAKVTKADANAKTAYVHRFRFDKKTGNYTFDSELVEINDKMVDDPAVKILVDKWGKVLNDNLETIYPKPHEIVYDSPEKLDGRESSIRVQQTKMGEIFTAGIAAAAKKKVDLAIMNSGSVRLDDQLEGKIQAIDIFRAMPFGGQVWELDISGAALQEVLQIGLNDQIGKGGYLQTHNVRLDTENKVWLIGGQAIQANKTYHLALNDYVYSGSRSVGDILQKFPADQPANGEMTDNRRDIRVAVIEYMKSL